MVFDIRLVIADVDGTLVTQEKVLTPDAIEAVERLRAAGFAFAITSGRPPRGMRMLIEPLVIEEPIAGFDGGVVVKPDMSVIFRSFLPADIARRVLEFLSREGFDAWVYTDVDWMIRGPASERRASARPSSVAGAIRPHGLFACRATMNPRRTQLWNCANLCLQSGHGTHYSHLA